jgi:hypothetical protein
MTSFPSLNLQGIRARYLCKVCKVFVQSIFASQQAMIGLHLNEASLQQLLLPRYALPGRWSNGIENEACRDAGEYDRECACGPIPALQLTSGVSRRSGADKYFSADVALPAPALMLHIAAGSPYAAAAVMISGAF